MTSTLRSALFLSLTILLSSAMTANTPASAQPVATVARLSAAPSIDDPAWETVPARDLSLMIGPGDRAPLESGKVRFAHDGVTLFARFELKDTDIVQESDEDQRHHYETGDVVELFLKPEGETWYWEFYATPNGRKTAFFYPGRGRKGLPGNLSDYRSEVSVTARVDGTLNNWRDRDAGWTALISIPLAELAAPGVPFDGKTTWKVLIGRYNYGRYLPDMELSMYPALTRRDFHRHEEWALLDITN